MEKNKMIKTFIASANISELQLVKVDVNGKVLPCSASTDVAIGVCQRSVSAGEPVEIIVQGETQAIAGGVLTAGTHNFLQSDASGRCVAYASADAGTQIIVGRWIPSDAAASAAANQYIQIVFNPAIGG
jgi:hypothetical protein